MAYFVGVIRDHLGIGVSSVKAGACIYIIQKWMDLAFQKCTVRLRAMCAARVVIL